MAKKKEPKWKKKKPKPPPVPSVPRKGNLVPAAIKEKKCVICGGKLRKNEYKEWECRKCGVIHRKPD